MPIGRRLAPEADSFKGIFDGNGFVIKNLTIDSNSENVGLFGHTTLATIKNVGLENVNIKAGAGTSESQINVGAFVGTATSTTLSNVYVTGTIAGVNTDTNDIYAGGLVGNLNVYSSIINSYSKADVSGSTSGGLVGEAQGHTSISKSYADGNVHGYLTAGGLVGTRKNAVLNVTYKLTITDSYSLANVTAEKRTAAGIIGNIVGNATTDINNVYVAGHIEGNTVGAFVGTSNVFLLNITNSYWDIDSTGATTGLGSKLQKLHLKKHQELQQEVLIKESVTLQALLLNS